MNLTRSIGLSLSLACVCGVAAAHEPPAGGDEPVLRGPAVHDAAVPGERSSFTRRAGRRDGDAEIPHRAFMRAIDALRADPTPAEHRLTAEQDKAINDITAAYRATLRTYFEKHRAELESLRARLPANALQSLPPGAREQLRTLRENLQDALGPAERRKPGANERARLGPQGKDTPVKDAPAKESPMDDAMQPVPREGVDPAVRDRLRQLLEGAPRAQAAHAKVWAVLTDHQRSLVQNSLERLRRAEEQRRREMAGERAPDQSPPGQAQPVPTPQTRPAPQRPVAILDDPRVPERLRERIRNMSPEDRQRALAQLRERLENADRDQPPRDGGARRNPNRQPQGHDVPTTPPGMDSVDVPKPDGGG